MKLTTWAISLAWLVAALIAVAVLISVALVRQHRLDARFVGHDAVFLGTSLTRFALPDYAVPAPMPQIRAKSAMRIGLSNGSDSEVLTLTSAALAAQVAHVFVEVNPIISRFANNTHRCDVWDTLPYLSDVFRRSGIATLWGRDLSYRGALEVANDGPRSLHFDQMDKIYPLQIDTPCHLETWRQLAESRPDTQIVLIAMPRSKIARDRIGPDGMEAFNRAAEAFSSQINVPLFIPDASGAWDDKFFLDRAHMNRAGAAHFLRALASWRASLSLK